MKTNMGNTDRVVRLIMAAFFGILFFYNALPPFWGYTLLVIGIIFATTSFIGFCPLYKLFGVSTCRKGERIS